MRRPPHLQPKSLRYLRADLADVRFIALIPFLWVIQSDLMDSIRNSECHGIRASVHPCIRAMACHSVNFSGVQFLVYVSFGTLPSNSGGSLQGSQVAGTWHDGACQATVVCPAASCGGRRETPITSSSAPIADSLTGNLCGADLPACKLFIGTWHT